MAGAEGTTLGRRRTKDWEERGEKGESGVSADRGGCDGPGSKGMRRPSEMEWMYSAGQTGPGVSLPGSFHGQIAFRVLLLPA